jgi:hypothetical protein|tara:strand:+ start:4611 stop:5063 length:453 start_codon:yes stop_codon:yes gene_type:complete
MNTELLKQLGIDPTQVEIKEKSRDDFPDYWDRVIDNAQSHIYKTFCGDFNMEECHWKIPYEVVESVFKEYEIEASWRTVNRQLGNCNYSRKLIRMNFGHPSMNKDQARKTLLHEYVHAITYKHFSRNQKHNFNFKFYLNLLVPLKGVQGV